MGREQTPAPFLYLKPTFNLTINADSGVFVGNGNNMNNLQVDANEKDFCEIIDDFKNSLSKKKCPIIFSGIISLIPLLLFLFCEPSGNIDRGSILNTLSEANVSLLGFNIASFAIIISLLDGKKLDTKAMKAFDEQSISFLGNAMFQLLALCLYIIYMIIQVPFMMYMTFFVQIWAIVLVFDVIIELYCIASLIRNSNIQNH